MNYSKYFQLILSGFLIGCILFCLTVYYQIGAPTESSRWDSEIYTIKYRIAQSISTPKLVVVSGSSALFGISCQMIQEDTGVPCVNGGTNAGLGIDYILWQARSLVKPKDIILLPLEYESYIDDGIPKNQVIDYVFSRDLKYLSSVDFITQIRFISGISFERLKIGILAKFNPPQPLKTVYQSETINDYGDETKNRESDRTIDQINEVDRAKPSPIAGYLKSSQGMKSIENFIAWCRKNDIEVIATWSNTINFPIYQEQEQQEFFQSIEDFYKRMKVPILSNPTNAMYDKSMFYDTMYHLHDRGRRYRTRQLIDLLRPYLENSFLTSEENSATVR
jgi:hypothetical protein